MASAFAKDIRRSIKGSLGRFLAIAIICALGCGFYTGLRSAAPDMKLSGDEYYDATRTYDIQVRSTLGLADADLERLAAVDGVAEVAPERELDAVATIGQGQYTVRIHSLDVDAARSSDTSDGLNAISDDEGYLNRPILVSGSWPDEPGECLLAYDPALEDAPQVGDVAHVVEGAPGEDPDRLLSTRDFTICGFVRTGSYPSSTGLGVTSLGNGSLDTYLLVADSDFDQEQPYTGAWLTVSGAAALDSSSDAYKELVDGVVKRLEDEEPDLAAARLADVKADAQAELDDNRASYEDEKADVQARLDDAQVALDGSAEELAAAEEELGSGQAELDASRERLERGEMQLADGRESYDAGAAELAAQRASAEEAFSAAQEQIDARQAQLYEALAGLPGLREQLAQLDSSIADLEAGMAAVQAQIDALPADTPPDDPQLAALAGQLEVLSGQLSQAQAGRGQLADAIAQTEGGQDAIDAAQAQLDAQRSAAVEAFVEAQAQLDAAASQLEDSAAELASGWSAYEEGAAQLAEARSQYDEGLTAYQAGASELAEQRAAAEQGFADAEAELADAQSQIDDLEAPEWYVLDRSQNQGIASFEADANRMDRIARVFPLIFFLVAALVSLTTMTRMVEEERVLIGTYKALGYSTAAISSKYLVYAAVAASVGAVAGIIGLTLFLPQFIMNAYSILYKVPARVVRIDPGLALLSGGLGVAITLGATLWAVGSTLREHPAALMLPRAPKPGKRILLEHIKPLWSRMSFSWKVTSRNLFRYKRRLVMTVIGIAGCTALLLTGFGLENAINDIIDIQWGPIYHYSFTATLKDGADEDEQAALDGLLGGEDAVESWTWLRAENTTAAGPAGADQRVTLVVPRDPEDFASYVTMRERIGHAPLALDDGSVVVSEKLATAMGVGVGDTVTLYEQDNVGNAVGEGHAYTVGGVMENYVGEYLFATPECYREVMGESPAFNTVYARTADDASVREQLSSEVLALDGVSTAGYNDELIDYYRTALKSVDGVVVVLIVAAAALAFVGLYNLTNINITERTREIATLKVLGFNAHEVNAYIYRETILLSLIGALLGCVLGIFLEGFVVVTAEVDQVMFGRTIHPSSFVIAFVLTMLFSVLVTVFMRGKLRRVDMVGSLKSVD